ncbi:MAG: polysaccharide biosynthesis C-terminal domain-containing protein [Thermoleophilaceae bacterium]
MTTGPEQRPGLGDAEAAASEPVPTPPGDADAAARTTGHGVALGGLWNSVSQVLPQAYTLIVSVAAARYLGPAGMGRQSFIAFVEIAAIELISGAMKESVTRHVGETLGRGRPGQVRALLGWAGRVQLVGALAGGAVLVGVGLAGADPRGAWIFAGIAGALAIGQTVQHSALAGAQRWRDASVAGLLAGTLAVPAMIVVLAAGAGITGMFAVEAGAVGLGLIGTAALARRYVQALPADPQLDTSLRSATARFAGIATFSVLIHFIIWKRSEFFFLSAYSSDSQIAFYSIAFAAVSGVSLLPDAMSNSLSPAFATLHGAEARDRIRSGYWRSQRLLVLMTLPMTAGLIALGPELIRLVYGGAYRDTGPILLVLAAIFPLIPLRGVANAFLMGTRRLRFMVISEAIAGVVTIGLNFLLVPRFDAIGAAVANTCGQLSVVGPFLVYSGNFLRPVALGRRTTAASLVASAAAGLAAAGALAALGGLPGLLAGGVAGIVVFVAAGALLRPLSAEDATWLDELVRPRLGARAVAGVRLFARGPAQPPP